MHGLATARTFMERGTCESSRKALHEKMDGWEEARRRAERAMTAADGDWLWQIGPPVCSAHSYRFKGPSLRLAARKTCISLPLAARKPKLVSPYSSPALTVWRARPMLTALPQAVTVIQSCHPLPPSEIDRGCFGLFVYMHRRDISSSQEKVWRIEHGNKHPWSPLIYLYIYIYIYIYTHNGLIWGKINLTQA